MKTNSTYKLGAFAGAMWTVVATFSFVATAFSLPAAAQDVEGQLYCSVYFQARADWMHGLDGNKETIDLMESYAEILWASVPKDFGMPTGFSTPSPFHQPDTDAVLRILTKWAESGWGAFRQPLCMEDVKCLQCMDHLRMAIQ